MTLSEISNDRRSIEAELGTGPTSKR